MSANRNSVALLSIDPGATTGCAAGLFDLRQPTVAATMRRARSKRNIWSWEVVGDHVSQSWEMAKWFQDWQFKYHVELGVIMAGQFYITMENFIPRQLNFDDISLLVIGGFETLLAPAVQQGHVRYERQEPVERWCDDDWLKRNGLWVRSAHERDARRHVARKIDKLLHGAIS
jgi:hypothetical protein